MFELYSEAFRALWEYQEFRSLFMLFRWSLLFAAGFVVVVGLMHLAYLAGYNALLYRKRSPKLHWTRRLMPAVLLMSTCLIGLYLWSASWITAAS